MLHNAYMTTENKQQSLLPFNELLDCAIRYPAPSANMDYDDEVRSLLVLNSDGAEIALLAMRFYFDGTDAGPKCIRQPKDHLR